MIANKPNRKYLNVGHFLSCKITCSKRSYVGIISIKWDFLYRLYIQSLSWLIILFRSICRICPIWISEPGQLFRSQFVLHLTLWTGLAGATRLTRSVCMIHMDWIYFYQRGRFAWPLFVCQIIHYTLLKYFVKEQIPNLTFRFTGL